MYVLTCICLNCLLSVHCLMNYCTKPERLLFAIVTLLIISFLLYMQRQTRKRDNTFTKLLMTSLYVPIDTSGYHSHVCESLCYSERKISKHFRKLHNTSARLTTQKQAGNSKKALTILASSWFHHV